MLNSIRRFRSSRFCLHRFGFYTAISAKSDRHYGRNMQETLERPEKRGSFRIFTLILSMPVIFYFYLLIPGQGKIKDSTKPVTKSIIEESSVDYKAAQKLYFMGPKAPIKTVEDALLLLKKPKKNHLADRSMRIFENFTDVDVFTGTTFTTIASTTKSTLPECVFIFNATDEIKLNTSEIKYSLEDIYPMVQNGGYYKPLDCWSNHKVAVMVPYRNRTRNLSIFLYNIHPFLMKQKLEYRIFVIEQLDNVKEFNKGRLLNAGFLELAKFGSWSCLVMHDVDLLPLSARIRYSCPAYPRHMSATVIDRGSTKDTNSLMLFGGVTAITLKHYKKANGHSNLYWGWGGEDYDMFWRIRAAGLPVVRYNRTVARYLALPHENQRINPARYKLLHRAIDRWQEEGLSDVRYKVISVTNRHLYTHITVDVNPYKEIINSRLFPPVLI